MIRTARLLSLLFALALLPSLILACGGRRGGGGGGGDDDDDDGPSLCSQANSATTACWQAANISTEDCENCPIDFCNEGMTNSELQCWIDSVDAIDCGDFDGTDNSEAEQDLWFAIAGASVSQQSCLEGDDDDDTSSGDDDTSSGDDDTSSGDDDTSSGDDDTSSGDDDTSVGDDDTSVGDDDTVGPTGQEALPCDDQYADLYEVWGASTGDEVYISIDTISSSSAFDPWLLFLDSSLDYNNALGNFDDEFTCTYPPPQYSCPQGSVTVPSGGLYFYVTHASQNCSGSLAQYSITMTVDGFSSNDWYLVSDDDVLAF
jgi:hypothetical protein